MKVEDEPLFSSEVLENLREANRTEREREKASLDKLNGFGRSSGDGEEGGGKSLKNPILMEELKNSGVKYNPEDVIAVTKTADGKLLWLESGNSSSGLKHIVDGHAADFTAKGINDIPQFLNDVLQTSPINTGKSAKGLFANYVVNESKYRVAYGTNGYVVSFYPID